MSSQAQEQQIPEVVRIAIANLKPGDVVLASYDRCQYRGDEVTAKFGPFFAERGAQFLAVPEGIDLSVLRLPRPEAGRVQGTAGEGQGRGIYTAGEAHDPERAS